MPANGLPSWSQLKSRLRSMEKEELLLLLQKLYAKSTENQVLIAYDCGALDAMLAAEPYRKIILRTFNPAHGPPSLDLRAARKALSDYKLMIREPAPVIDLMLFYVEQGAICTNNYGDIDDAFYRSLVSVYRDAVRLAAALDDPERYEPFRPRFVAVYREFTEIGWGAYDDMINIYVCDFPPESLEQVEQADRK